MSTKVFLAVSFSLGLLLFGGLIWFVDGQTINPFLVWFSYQTGTCYNSATCNLNCTALVIAAGYTTCPCPVGFSLYNCRIDLIDFKDNSVYSNFSIDTPTHHISTYLTGNGTCSESLSGTIGGSVIGDVVIAAGEGGPLTASITSGTASLSSSSCTNTVKSTSEQQVPAVTSTVTGSKQTVWNYVCQMEALCLVNPQLMASFHLDMEDAISSLKARRYANPRSSHLP